MNDAPVQSDSSLDSLVARVADEFRERQKRGERPNVEEYTARHPEAAALLRNVLAALDVLGQSQSAGVDAATALAEAPVNGELGDFRIVCEIGRGGMGVVYEAEQISLRRRVALKVLPLAGMMDPRHLQRFRNEAQAAACLHHGNIVPVYAVGQDRGVHFYAMQLIEGQTLAAAIQALAASDKPLSPKGRGEHAKPVDGQQTTPFNPALPAGGAVSTAAQAGSTALSGRGQEYFRSVARLGVQAAEALDYAHQLGVVHRDIKPANLMLDARGTLWVTDFGLAHIQHGEAGLTMTGDLVGTLRYMSPEQALAKRVLVDHRTDVYSLGATLYELLTLRPVFAGEDRQELLRQLAFEEPTPPCRINKAIPAELETVVLKALEKNPADRYATAQELAADLKCFLDDRPIQARRPSMLNRCGRWCRRHKATVTSSAVVLLVVSLGVGSFAGWRQRQIAVTENAVGEDLVEADVFQKQERWPEELQVLERASGRLSTAGLPHLREGVEGRRKNVAMVADLEEACLPRVTIVDGKAVIDQKGVDEAYTAAFSRYGLNLGALEPKDAAASIRASPIRIHLIAALDDWASSRKHLRAGSEEPLLVVARLADDDPWRQQLRDPKVRKDRTALERLARADDVLAQPPANLALLGRVLDEGKGEGAVLLLLRRAQERYPADFFINFELADCLVKEPATRAEAIGFYRAALAARPQSPAVYHNLGVGLGDQHKLREAEAAYRKAIDLQPDFAKAYNNLGKVLRDQHKLPEAETAWRKAIDLQPDFADAYNNLGVALWDQHKLPEAEAAYRKAIELQPENAAAYNNLGRALNEQKQRKLPEAEAACRKAIELRPDCAAAHNNLGVALVHQKRLPEAEAAYRKAIELQPDFAIAYDNLGAAFEGQKLLPDAVAAYRKAIELQPDLAQAYKDLGHAIYLQRKLPEAVAAYRKAIEFQPDFAMAYANLGLALYEQKQLPEAVAANRKAIELQPDYVAAYNNLGNALKDQRQLPEAVAAYRKAIELQPDYAKGYSNLGDTLREQKQLPAAEAALRKAVELQPDFAGAYNNLGSALRDQRRFPEAEAAYRKAIQLQPDCGDASHNLAIVLSEQERFADALAELKRCHELGSRNPGWPYLTAQWVRFAERLVELNDKLSAVLQGTVKPANANEYLEFAQFCQIPKQLHLAASGFYEKAFAAEPKLADDLSQGYRYNAACAAALAGCGQGKDAEHLDAMECMRLRKQALDWLRADLTAWRNLLDKDKEKTAPVVEQTLQHWLEDTDFNGVRGADALAKLPAAERGDWQKLWEEVETLRERAAAMKK